MRESAGLIDNLLVKSYTVSMEKLWHYLKSRGILTIAISIIIGTMVGWFIHRQPQVSTSAEIPWSYFIDVQEGTSALVVVNDGNGKQLCSGWEAPYDALYTNLDPHRIADILIEKRCRLIPGQQLATETTANYNFTHVDAGYIVTIPNDARDLGKIILITSNNSALYDYEPLGTTKYTVRELWSTPKGELLLGVSNDWWSFLTKSCAYPEGELHSLSDVCSYSIYDRHGKETARNFYTEKDLTQLTFSWYDPIHSGFLLVFRSEAPEQRRRFNYIFLPLVNNGRYQTIELATFTDQNAPPGKGCGFDISSTKDSIIIGGGCINPVGQPYPLVLPYAN